ncbi:MAG: N-acetylmuramoyl-L-alanine amidase [Pseudomonadales bacterium]
MSKFAEQFGVCRALIALAALCLAAPAVASTLQGLRIAESAGHTRVVLDLSAPAAFAVSTLAGPDRVIVDLPDAAVGAGFSEAVAANHKRIDKLRLARRDGGYRLVFDTPRAMTPNAFALDPVPNLGPAAPYGHRLVLDLFDGAKVASVTQPQPQRQSPSKQVARPAPKAPVAAPSPTLTPAKPSLSTAQAPRRKVLVAIDPGHGGNDPGAPGPGKIREKDVVLAISNKLAARINKQPGFQAMLVRTGDYYVNLRERVRQARLKGADLFISIHADAFTNPSVKGASVYTLSQDGASSEAARLLAAKENTSDLIGGIGRVSLSDKDDLLAGVLIDMSTNASRSASRKVGAAVLAELGTVTDLHKDVVEKAGFMVLKAPDIPSILVETGYISNPAEARRLASTSYQNKLANAISKGVVRFLKEESPPGTLLAAKSAPQPVRQPARPQTRHVIRRGDTLSGLAVRYGINASRIRAVNDLRSDAIRIGQKLIIPAS